MFDWLFPSRAHIEGLIRRDLEEKMPGYFRGALADWVHNPKSLDLLAAAIAERNGFPTVNEACRTQAREALDRMKANMARGDV